MRRVSGVSGAAPILHDLAVYMQRLYPSPSFKAPQGVSAVTVCAQSGLPAGENCAQTRLDYFIKGRVPAEKCSGKHENKEGEKIKIISPSHKDVFKMDPSVPPESQQLPFQAAGAADTTCVWKLNGEPLPQQGNLIWWQIQPGQFILQADCPGGGDSITFEVLP